MWRGFNLDYKKKHQSFYAELIFLNHEPVRFKRLRFFSMRSQIFSRLFATQTGKMISLQEVTIANTAKPSIASRGALGTNPK